MPVIMNKVMADFYHFATVKSEFLKANFPAWTAVGTTDLVCPDAEVEIKVTAIIGSGVNIRLQRERRASNESAD